MKKVRYKGKWYLYDEAKGTLTELDGEGNPTETVLTEFAKDELEPDDAGGGGTPSEALVKALRQEAARYRTELQALKEAIGGFKPDEIKSLVEDLEARKIKEEEARHEQLKKEGKLQQLLDEQKQKYEKQIAELKESAPGAKSELKSFRIKTELLKHAGRPDAVNPDQVTSLIQPFITVNEEGTLVVLDEDGKTTRLGKEAKPMMGSEGVKEFVDSFYEKNPWFVRGHAGGAGSGGDKGGGGAGKVRSRADLKSPQEKAAFISEHGQKAYLELPAGG